MTEEKSRRMVTGIVVGVTTVLFALLCILVWQIVTISVQNTRLAEAAAEEARLEQLIDDGEKSIEFYESIDGKNYLAFQKGWAK